MTRRAQVRGSPCIVRTIVKQPWGSQQDTTFHYFLYSRPLRGEAARQVYKRMTNISDIIIIFIWNNSHKATKCNQSINICVTQLVNIKTTLCKTRYKNPHSHTYQFQYYISIFIGLQPIKTYLRTQGFNVGKD